MIDPVPDSRRAMASNPTTLDQLAQARIDGHLSRRDLIRRATVLGFGAPIIATLLHATSDMAFGVPAAEAQGKTPIEMTGPTKPEGAPQTGGTIVAGSNQEPDTLHPWISQTVTGADVYMAVVEGLL
ncbi:MAG: hypothetical protein ACR2J8_10610, partial [Thermomicrobiales bacterium]